MAKKTLKALTAQELVTRIKAFSWHAIVLAVVAAGAYVLEIGDIWKLDWKILVNLAAIAVVGLISAQGTKWLNNLASKK